MIRIAGDEAQLPEEEAPVKTLYRAEKQTIMEAMGMIQQALDMLMEVCPPEGYVEDNMEAPLPGEEDTAGEELGIPEEPLG
jgi:hypothetical protein